MLSKDSVDSPWVRVEVEAAFEKERKQKRTVLFPIRLDDTVMKTTQAWAADSAHTTYRRLHAVEEARPVRKGVRSIGTRLEGLGSGA